MCYFKQKYFSSVLSDKIWSLKCKTLKEEPDTKSNFISEKKIIMP